MRQNISFEMNDQVLTIGRDTFYEILGFQEDATSEVAIFAAFLKMLQAVCGGDVQFTDGHGLGFIVEPCS